MQLKLKVQNIKIFLLVTFGIAGAISFFTTKVMTTGEGGMVTTNKKNLYKTMYSMRRFGMKKNKIFHDHISGNYKLSEFSALLGIIELKG